jgi:hypothetical protein
MAASSTREEPRMLLDAVSIGRNPQQEVTVIVAASARRA